MTRIFVLHYSLLPVLPGRIRMRLPALTGERTVLRRGSEANIWSRAEQGREVPVTPSLDSSGRTTRPNRTVSPGF